jgi:3-dehydroquinate dehydratase-2
MNILLINGPNLNLLGMREREIYGEITLSELEENLVLIAQNQGHKLHCVQTNAEHEIINAIHDAKLKNNINSIVINPGAFTHTSIAIRDALSGVEIPFYEVHISDINNREDFRKISYLSDIAKKVFSGQGLKGYELALNDAIKNNLEK